MGIGSDPGPITEKLLERNLLLVKMTVENVNRSL